MPSAGKQGVLTNAMYDNWWNGGNRTTPQRHNIVAVLTEAASVRMASPFLEKHELTAGSRGFRDHAPTVNFVDPWPGGWWRLRDIVDYELICARSILTLAAHYRQTFRRTSGPWQQCDPDRGERTPFAWGRSPRSA